MWNIVGNLFSSDPGSPATTAATPSSPQRGSPRTTPVSSNSPPTLNWLPDQPFSYHQDQHPFATTSNGLDPLSGNLDRDLLSSSPTSFLDNHPFSSSGTLHASSGIADLSPFLTSHSLTSPTEQPSFIKPIHPLEAPVRSVLDTNHPLSISPHDLTCSQAWANHSLVSPHLHTSLPHSPNSLLSNQSADTLALTLFEALNPLPDLALQSQRSSAGLSSSFDKIDPALDNFDPNPGGNHHFHLFSPNVFGDISRDPLSPASLVTSPTKMVAGSSASRMPSKPTSKHSTSTVNSSFTNPSIAGGNVSCSNHYSRSGFGKAPRGRGKRSGFVGGKIPRSLAAANNFHPSSSTSIGSSNSSGKVPRVRKSLSSAAPTTPKLGSNSRPKHSSLSRVVNKQYATSSDCDPLPREEQSFKLHFPGLVPTTAYPLEIINAVTPDITPTTESSSADVQSNLGSMDDEVNVDQTPPEDSFANSFLRPAGPLKPVPNADYYEIPDYYESLPKRTLDLPPFTMPYDGSYLLYTPNNQIEYDLDDRDRAWCDAQELEYDTAELMLDHLDKAWHGLVARLPHGVGVMGGPEVEDGHCIVCNDDECENANAIVFCDGCNIAVHQECYGVVNIPEGQWLCRRCETQSPPSTQCVLCGQTGGALKQTTDSRWVHVLCAIWIDEAHILQQQLMEPVDIAAIPPDRYALICSVCHKRIGACVQCSRASCCISFHVTCARQSGVYMENSRLLCDKHAPAAHRALKMRDQVGRGARRQTNLLSTLHLDAPAGIQVDISQKLTPLESCTENHLLKPASLSPYEFDPSHPVVNQFIFDRLMKALPDHVTSDQLVAMCKFWAVKRALRGGAPLLRRLVIDLSLGNGLPGSMLGPRDATGSGSGVDPGVHMALLILRHDLDRLRLLCDQVRKRERLRAQMIAVWARAWNICCRPLRSLLLPILNRAIAADVRRMFTQPVDTNLIVDYLDTISQPMDLSTIQRKLDLGLYGTPEQFADDMNLIWSNCKLFNPPSSIYYHAAAKCETELAPYLDAIKDAMLDSTSKLIPRVRALPPKMWPHNPTTAQRLGHDYTASHVQRVGIRSTRRTPATDEVPVTDYTPITPSRPPRPPRVREPSPPLPPPFEYPIDEQFEVDWPASKWANPIGQVIWKRIDPGLWWPVRIIGIDREWHARTVTGFPPSTLKSGRPFPVVRRVIKDINYHRLVIPMFREGTTSLDAQWATTQKLRVLNFENDSKRVRVNHMNTPKHPQEIVDAALRAYHKVMQMFQPWLPSSSRPIPGLNPDDILLHQGKRRGRNATDVSVPTSEPVDASVTVDPVSSEHPIPSCNLLSDPRRSNSKAAPVHPCSPTALEQATPSRKRGRESDAVTRFHLRNGSSVNEDQQISASELTLPVSDLTRLQQPRKRPNTRNSNELADLSDRKQSKNANEHTVSQRRTTRQRNDGPGLNLSGTPESPVHSPPRTTPRFRPLAAISSSHTDPLLPPIRLSRTRAMAVQQQHRASESESLSDFEITDDDSGSRPHCAVPLADEPGPVRNPREVLTLKLSKKSLSRCSPSTFALAPQIRVADNLNQTLPILNAPPPASTSKRKPKREQTIPITRFRIKRHAANDSTPLSSLPSSADELGSLSPPQGRTRSTRTTQLVSTRAKSPLCGLSYDSEASTGVSPETRRQMRNIANDVAEQASNAGDVHPKPMHLCDAFDPVEDRNVGQQQELCEGRHGSGKNGRRRGRVASGLYPQESRTRRAVLSSNKLLNPCYSDLSDLDG